MSENYVKLSMAEHKEVRHYLSEIKDKEELSKFILYPSELWIDLHEQIAEDNANYSEDVAAEILQPDWRDWVDVRPHYDSWYWRIKGGHYLDALQVCTDAFFSSEDEGRIQALKKQIEDVCAKIDKLDEDDLLYYDKLGELEDKADEYAQQILDVVEPIIKETEEVRDEQIMDMFEICELGDSYYYLNDDKTTLYRDTVESYKTAYKPARTPAQVPAETTEPAGKGA